MFCWQAQTFLKQLAILKPVTAQAIGHVVAQPERLAEIYPELERISVDYAIMQPVSHGLGTAHIEAVPLTTSWDDIGGYLALAAHLEQTTDNATSGKVVALDATGNILVNAGPEDSLIAVVGLTDTIVVTHGQVTLVCPRSAAEEIKELVKEVGRVVGADYV